MIKWMFRLTAFLLVLIVLAGAGAGYAYYRFTELVEEAGPTAGADAPLQILIPRGSGVSKISSMLEAKGAVTDARLFRLATRYKEADTSMKAGEYAIPAGASMSEIIDLLVEGKVILHPVQIIEGTTVAQAMKVIAASEVLIGELPPEPPEGSLLPDTYSVTRGTSRAEVVQLMMRAQDRLLDEIWEARDPDLPIRTREEAVILASVVEKETGIPTETGLVAGVFVNRLNRGMRLQSDPTIIYGISKGEPLFNRRGERRTLYRSEIDRETPWNTYQIDGLPKTPICNPGSAAIRSVLNPPKTDYLFFVADGSGGHAFAQTNTQHERNVRKWRVIERERIQQERAG